jgi:N-methylhydantoinase A
MTEFRVRGVGPLTTPDLAEHEVTEGDAASARVGTNEMHFEEAGGRVEAGVYDFEDLTPGDRIQGPGVVLTPVTTIVVNPSDVARMDRYRNIRIDVGGTEDDA